MQEGTELKQKILTLREQGCSYRDISKQLSCARSTVAYYLGVGQKEKAHQRRKKFGHLNPLARKVYGYKEDDGKLKKCVVDSIEKIEKIIYYKVYTFMEENLKDCDFTVQDVLDKIGDDPRCYLTGRSIDLSKSRSYQLDHIVPRSRGGSNSLDNLGLCVRDANQAKYDMMLDDFLDLCRDILLNHGYIITSLKEN